LRRRATSSSFASIPARFIDSSALHSRPARAELLRDLTERRRSSAQALQRVDRARTPQETRFAGAQHCLALSARARTPCALCGFRRLWHDRAVHCSCFRTGRVALLQQRASSTGQLHRYIASSSHAADMDPLPADAQLRRGQVRSNAACRTAS
jgi:hypothetical protein